MTLHHTPPIPQLPCDASSFRREECKYIKPHTFATHVFVASIQGCQPRLGSYHGFQHFFQSNQTATTFVCVYAFRLWCVCVCGSALLCFLIVLSRRHFGRGIATCLAAAAAWNIEFVGRLSEDLGQSGRGISYDQCGFYISAATCVS